MRIPFKKTAILTLASAICFTLIRILQIFFCVDAKTGFFRAGFQKTGTEFSIVIFAFLLLSFIFSFLEPKTINEYPKTSLPLAIGYLFLAGILIYDLIFFPVTFSLNGPQRLLFTVFGVLTAVVSVLEAVSFFYPIPYLSFIYDENNRILPIFSICGLLFWVLRTVFFFAFYTEMAVVSDHVFDIIALLFILIFVLYIAFLANGVQPVKAKKRFLPFLILAFLSGVASSLPHILLFVFGFGEKLHSFNSNHITVLGVTAFIALFYFTAFTKDNLREKIKKHQKDFSRFIR